MLTLDLTFTLMCRVIHMADYLGIIFHNFSVIEGKTKKCSKIFNISLNVGPTWNIALNQGDIQ